MWAAVAPSWAEPAVCRRPSRRGDERMLDLAAPGPGQRVLERVRRGWRRARRCAAVPGGEVVISDVADEMVAGATNRAAALGLAERTTRVVDLERIEEPDGGYDVVLCPDGLQFAVRSRTARHERSSTCSAPGTCRPAAGVHRERNPWLGLVLDAASAQLGRPMPPPGVPGPFSLADCDELAHVLADAGFGDVTITELPVPLRVASFDEWWALTTSLVGPLAASRRVAPGRGGRRDAASGRVESARPEYHRGRRRAPRRRTPGRRSQALPSQLNLSRAEAGGMRAPHRLARWP